MLRQFWQSVVIILSSALSLVVIAGILFLIWLDFAPHVIEMQVWPANDRIEAPVEAETELTEAPVSEPVPDPIAQIFEGVSSITFFIERPLAGTDREIITGAAFRSPEAVAAGRPEKQWCYVNVGSDGQILRINLGDRTGSATPVFADLAGIAPEIWAELGTNRQSLEAAARESCVFRDFDPREARS